MACFHLRFNIFSQFVLLLDKFIYVQLVFVLTLAVNTKRQHECPQQFFLVPCRSYAYSMEEPVAAPLALPQIAIVAHYTIFYATIIHVCATRFRGFKMFKKYSTDCNCLINKSGAYLHFCVKVNKK